MGDSQHGSSPGRPGGGIGARGEQGGGRDAPSLSLPTAGGAIRGMGEKFSANPVTGTASMSVPLALSPGRGGVSPQLTLSYDSGAGNGPYGLGWTVDLPSISRTTDRGLPRYLDDEDTFQLSGADDLVTALSPDGRPVRRSEGPYDIRAYRPRTEGLFARVERWRHTASGETHWRVTTKDNVTSVFGRDASARIADPAAPARVFRWLLQETRDDRGNLVVYTYKREDTAGVDAGAPHERNRLGDGAAKAQRYLKRVRYGNVEDDTDFCFEAVLDYGEHDDEKPTPEEDRPWPVRRDPFSAHRAGFELRTYRLCRRVLMFHQFDELGDDPVLVRSTDLGYRHDPALTYLTSVVQKGFVRDGDGYREAEVPPLTFGYTERSVSAQVRPLAGGHGESPARLDAAYQWADLDGEGVSGILTEQAGAWFYRANLGGGAIDAPKTVASQPNGAGLAGRGGLPGGGSTPDGPVRTRQLMDLAGTGIPDLVDLGGAVPGYHARTQAAGWQDFAPFAGLPSLSWTDPNLRFVDLTGDGLTDVLLTADDGLTWYPGAGHDGFGDARQLGLAATEEHGPRLLLADPEQSVHLADMTGDGLTDLVRIRNGEVAYWPNLGYGRFGAKVAMSGAPLFDHPDRFDHRRLHLFDVDGSAPADLLYAGSDGVRLWFNQAGNSWSPPQHVDVPVDRATGVSVADVLGKGTACLVLAQPGPDTEPQVRYVDLMAAGKPHLLTALDNHSGLRTTITYESSTAYYLADKAAGRPWATRPNFPVHVVAAVQTRDSVANTTLVTTYAYRHGYYDGTEREFRGFGYVEQRDALRKARPGDRRDELVQPPALVKRWQHTGWYAGRDAVARQFEDEYWPGDDGSGDGFRLPDTVLPDGLSTDEERQACRALRGNVLRTELYAEDGGPLEKVPYQVSEHSYTLRLIQPAQSTHYAVLFAHHAETLSVHTERRSDDPRVAHEFTLQVDAYGNPVRTATVAYPRAGGDPAQQRLWITVQERDVVNDVDTTARWRIGTEIETRAYEIGGVTRNAAVFTAAVLDAGLAAAARNEVPYQDDLSGTIPQRRLIARTATTYHSDDLETELPHGRLGERALVWRTYQQVFAPGQVAALFGEGRVTDATLTQAGYVRRADDGVWWAPSHRAVPDPECYYQPVELIDQFSAAATIEYDQYCLLPVRTRDALGNTTQVRISYRVLKPWLLTDPNGNRSGVRYDALGMVTATAVLGKEGASEGDHLDLSTPESSSTDDPTVEMVYDLVSVPVSVHTMAREEHGAAEPRSQETRAYVDGMGRVILTKTRAEPGMAPVRGPDGKLIRNPDGTLRLQPTDRRWVGTGRTVYDNKGDPVRQYEPYFAPDERFDTEDDLVRYGVTPILRHDPLGRLVETEHPDGSASRMVFDTWRQEAWDRNDTVRNSRWYAERVPPTCRRPTRGTAPPGRRSRTPAHRPRLGWTRSAACTSPSPTTAAASGSRSPSSWTSRATSAPSPTPAGSGCSSSGSTCSGTRRTPAAPTRASGGSSWTSRATPSTPGTAGAAHSAGLTTCCAVRPTPTPPRRAAPSGCGCASTTARPWATARRATCAPVPAWTSTARARCGRCAPTSRATPWPPSAAWPPTR
ncbi:SpvB/TcaC N-terminal domain-containing protein [Actinomadura sp. 9N215]|uniref:SpvB/TcaC N-terminal domain-containing protein n=1 Tax=Actinomadura sp. 9N215 TaxID=3375150 RepID=UPI0037B20377